MEVGTEIIIPLTDHAAYFFENTHYSYETKWYDWYHFSKPEISITLNGLNYLDDISLKPRFFVPSAKGDHSGWFYSASKEYTSIHWRYNTTQERPVLLCNGISIHGFGREQEKQEFEPFVAESNLGINLRLPEISIVDKEGNLGLNISRSDVTYFKLEDKFGEDLCKNWLAQILISQPLDEAWNGQNIMSRYNPVFTFDRTAFTVGCRTFLFHTRKNILIVGRTNRWITSKGNQTEKTADSLVVYEDVSQYSSFPGLSFDHQILLDRNGVSSSCQELWIRKTDGVQL